MELDKKRFPVRLDPNKAIEIIRTTLKRKGHSETIKKEDLYLTITPYWVCFFDILKNTNGNFKHVNGQIAINSINNMINEKVIEIFKLAKPKIYKTLNVPKTEKTQIIIKEAITTKEEAERSILKYLVHKFGVNMEGVSLSGMEEICVPNWKIKLKKYKLKLDAISGKVNDFDKIKGIDKNSKDLFNEMLSDLKSPKKVGFYFFNIFKELFEGIAWILQMVWKNYKVTLWIILIALVIYLIFL